MDQDQRLASTILYKEPTAPHPSIIHFLLKDQETLTSTMALLPLPVDFSTDMFFQDNQPFMSQDFAPRQELMMDYRSINSLLFLNDPHGAASDYSSLKIAFDESSQMTKTSQPSAPGEGYASSQGASPGYPESLPEVSSGPSSLTTSQDIKSESLSLRQMIASECQKVSCVPTSLLQLPQHQLDVSSRELAVLARLKKAEASSGEQVKNLSQLFLHHSSSIEMERVQMLSLDNTTHYNTWLNSNFDQQRHQVMDRVERSLELLEKKAESDKLERDQSAGIRRRNPLSKKAIQQMESWFESHRDHPYPSAAVVEALARSGNVTTEQVRKWFANKRIRTNNTHSLTEIAKQKHRAKYATKNLQMALQHSLY